MVKKMTALFLCMLLLPCLVFSASGQSEPYVTDDAAILKPEEIAFLEEKAAQLASLYNIDPVILTVDSLNGSSAQDCADDYYDQAGFREDGVLFLLAMAEREWYISTAGSVVYALTDYGIAQLGESIVPNLAGEAWYDGFYLFLDALPDYLDAYKKGTPIDGYADDFGDSYHGNQEEIMYYEEDTPPSLLISLGCGLLAAGVTILLLRFSMNTKRAQRSAGVYLKAGSWDLYHRRDLYLYSNVTKTRIQNNDSHDGGGSSVHTSSIGRRHGGGGGKF